MSVRKLSLYTPAGRKVAGEGGGHWAGSFSSEFPIQIEAPIKKILRRLRDRGIISRRRPWPIHVACLMNVSDGDIVNRSAGIAISPLSYYSAAITFTKSERLSTTRSAGLLYSPQPTSTNPRRGI
ncbi:Domain X [Macleaya cordata]|uniref:Domain X n=1 Tax=Macleaya cordata TaxID=56857 RepID=A0A200QKA3_MACCD|nr:Domain X [Macleaya cordata]